jgi:hypothetical protein
VFFDDVADIVVAFVPSGAGPFSRRATGRNVKVWFGDEQRQHYEAQFLSGRQAGLASGGRVLEVGFHAEYPDPLRNVEVLERLAAAERRWRGLLGRDAVLGPFLGRQGWIRLSEVWDDPARDEEGAAVEVAERLARYAEVLEPLRPR